MNQLNHVLKPLRKPCLFEKNSDMLDVQWFGADLLAVSCYSHRIGLGYLRTDLVSHLEPCDHILAQEIREHYRNRITLQLLKGIELSSFRSDLLKFLETDHSCKNGQLEGFVYSSKVMGMVTKLPYFYQYDKDIERLFGGSYNTLNGKYVDQTAYDEQHLVFQNRLEKKTRIRTNYEYWFKNSNNDFVLIPIKMDNPLDYVFKKIVHEGPINVRANFNKKQWDSIEYLTVAPNWQIVD